MVFSKYRKRIIEFIILGIIWTAIFMRIFFIDFVVVKGDSMYPTYVDRDMVFINKAALSISRYDIVVIRLEQNKIIKRVIGLPNETIQIFNGHVYIDGEILKDDIIDISIDYAGIAESPIELSDNCYFVLGDNREHSQDSRYEEIGLIDKKQIVGVVIKKVLHH